MNAGEIYGRGIGFPPSVGDDGRLAWSEGEENVRESIRIVLLTQLKERLRRPAFGGGLEEFLFEPNNVATRHALSERITSALAAWEPRITVQSVEVDPDPTDRETAVATVNYKLIATQTQGRIDLHVSLS